MLCTTVLKVNGCDVITGIDWTTIEGVCGIRPKVTFDAMSNSPNHS